MTTQLFKSFRSGNGDKTACAQQAWRDSLCQAVRNFKAGAMFAHTHNWLVEFFGCVNQDTDFGGAMALGMELDTVSDDELIINFLCDHARLYAVKQLAEQMKPELSPNFLRIHILPPTLCVPPTGVVTFYDIEAELDHYLRQFSKMDRGARSHLRQSVHHLLKVWTREDSHYQCRFHMAVIDGPEQAKYFRFWVIWSQQVMEITFRYGSVINEFNKFLRAKEKYQ